MEKIGPGAFGERGNFHLDGVAQAFHGFFGVLLAHHHIVCEQHTAGLEHAEVFGHGHFFVGQRQHGEHGFVDDHIEAVVGEGQLGGVGVLHLHQAFQSGGTDVLPGFLQRVFVQIHAGDVAAEALRQPHGGGAHIAGHFEHLRIGGEAGLVNQPFGGETAAGAQAGFAQAGEEMMAGLVFFHKILLCGCGERGCRA